MRLFIAVDLPHEAKDELERQKQELTGLNAKLVPKENLHITLKFLGDVSDERVPGMISALQGFAFHPFRVRLGAAGAFPKESFANVIWVSAEPVEALVRVKEQVDRALPKFVDDKPFKSHITIARLEGADVRAVLHRINLKLEKKEILVSKVTLYRSELTPKGPKYSKLL